MKSRSTVFGNVFWSVFACLGNIWWMGVVNAPPQKLDMDWLVKFRLDMACESSGLRGKSRL